MILSSSDLGSAWPPNVNHGAQARNHGKTQTNNKKSRTPTGCDNVKDVYDVYVSPGCRVSKAGSV
jgi:hypothetical protein